MSDIETDAQLPQAEKIAKLLRLAETTENEAEAEAFNQRAQQLMVKYAINERLINMARGQEEKDTVAEERIDYKGIFHMALFRIGSVIAHNNDCRVLITKYSGESRTTLHVIGFTKDIADVKVLDASIQVQASTAMQRWYREQNVQHKTPMEKSKMRREFLFGFANGLNSKLGLARRAGVKQATADEAKRTGDTDTAEKSTELVLRTKKEHVDEWMDTKYGNSLRSVRGNYSSGGYAARAAGTTAGRSANVGQPGIGGKRELER